MIGGVYVDSDLEFLKKNKGTNINTFYGISVVIAASTITKLIVVTVQSTHTTNT